MAEAFWLNSQNEAYPLGSWVADRREEGVAWRAIAAELRDRTEGVIDLPQQTLVNWYGDVDREPAA